MEAPQYLPSNLPAQPVAAPVHSQSPSAPPVAPQAEAPRMPEPAQPAPPAPTAYASQPTAYEPVAYERVASAPVAYERPPLQAEYQEPVPPTHVPTPAAAQYLPPLPEYLPAPAPAPLTVAPAAAPHSSLQLDYNPAPPMTGYEPVASRPHTQPPQHQQEQAQYLQTEYQQPGLAEPPVGYQQPPVGYQQPPADYPSAPVGYQQPPAGYQQPPADYPSAPVGYQQPPVGYQQPPAVPAASPVQPPPPQTEYRQAAMPASRMDFAPLPSPVVFEPEPDRRGMVAADIFASQSAPAAVPTPMRHPVEPAVEMRRDDSLRADPDLDAALQLVLDLGASDLHIAVKTTPMIRIDGGLRALDGAQVWSESKVANALKSILTADQLAIYEDLLEFDFAYTLSSEARFRVNFYQQRDSMGAAFRLIPTEIKSLKELGVPDSIAEFAHLPRGLVLITGPTGSGKSTTLAGLIDIVNRTRADHIMTVEDPIEFLHVNHKSLINQREVGHDTHSFAAALKHVLRQDPDVILVGELRDLETISVALTAAETGHLVFATLHTSDAPQTIDRIIDVYPPHQQSQVRAQLAATLQGVVCQTLIKKASGKGRVVATEVLVRTSAVANLIREGKTFQIHSAMQAGRDLGMHTIDQHLADLVSTGQITLEAAKEKSHDLQVLERLIGGSRAPTATGGNMAESMSYGGSS